jgi:Uma2 family endonuclease
MVENTQTRIRTEDYYQLPEYAQHDLIQLINGEVVIGTIPVLKHQGIVREILMLFTLHARQNGGETFGYMTEVYLDEYNSFEPDVLYICPDNLTITQQDDKRIVGTPDLVVEVLSPSTAKYDRQEKYEAYQQHGVSEYWIVDPAHEVVEVWTLGEGGQFVRGGAYGSADSFKSAVLGETVAVKAIFND